jgi:hypothetical protein
MTADENKNQKDKRGHTKLRLAGDEQPRVLSLVVPAKATGAAPKNKT